MASSLMNRKPLPPDAAAAALRSMQGVTNVGSLTNRGLDIAQGLGDFEPTDAELMGAQLNAPNGISREQIREGAMSKVKQMLGMQAAEQARKLELGKQKVDAEAQARAGQNEAIAARQREAAEMNEAFRRQQQEDAQQHAAEMQAERLAAQAGKPATSRTTLPTDQMDKDLKDKRSAYGGMWNSLVRKLPGGFDGGTNDLRGAIESIRTRMGVEPEMSAAAFEALQGGQTTDQAIAEALAQGVQLSPQQQQFLRYVLGK